VFARRRPSVPPVLPLVPLPFVPCRFSVEVMVVPDRDSVYQRALTQLQQLPEQSEAQQLRVALDRFDTEGAWTLMSPRFKAAPGSHSHKNYLQRLP